VCLRTGPPTVGVLLGLTGRVGRNSSRLEEPELALRVASVATVLVAVIALLVETCLENAIAAILVNALGRTTVVACVVSVVALLAQAWSDDVFAGHRVPTGLDRAIVVAVGVGFAAITISIVTLFTEFSLYDAIAAVFFAVVNPIE
jgi:hypothetical protein